MKRLALAFLSVGVFLALPVPASAQADTPESRRQAVADILKSEKGPAGSTAEQHASAMRSLGFDAFAVAGELLVHNSLGMDAARAMLVIDEERAMALIFKAIPAARLSTQLVGFQWFLEHESTIGHRVDAEAHGAAVRVLTRIESTVMAQLALYTIGRVGSGDDFTLLQGFVNARTRGSENLRVAAESALLRLGSEPHLEQLRAELAAPVPIRVTYFQAARLAQLLRQAGFSANTSLVPLVCDHIDDPVGVDIDFRIEPAVVATTTLSLLLEPESATLPRGAPRRSYDDWRAYCATLPRP